MSEDNKETMVPKETPSVFWGPTRLKDLGFDSVEMEKEWQVEKNPDSIVFRKLPNLKELENLTEPTQLVATAISVKDKELRIERLEWLQEPSQDKTKPLEEAYGLRYINLELRAPHSFDFRKSRATIEDKKLRIERLKWLQEPSQDKTKPLEEELKAPYSFDFRKSRAVIFLATFRPGCKINLSRLTRAGVWSKNSGWDPDSDWHFGTNVRFSFFTEGLSFYYSCYSYIPSIEAQIGPKIFSGETALKILKEKWGFSFPYNGWWPIDVEGTFRALIEAGRAEKQPISSEFFKHPPVNLETVTEFLDESGIFVPKFKKEKAMQLAKTWIEDDIVEMEEMEEIREGIHMITHTGLLRLEHIATDPLGVAKDAVRDFADYIRSFSSKKVDEEKISRWNAIKRGQKRLTDLRSILKETNSGSYDRFIKKVLNPSIIGYFMFHHRRSHEEKISVIKKSPRTSTVFRLARAIAIARGLGVTNEENLQI